MSTTIKIWHDSRLGGVTFRVQDGDLVETGPIDSLEEIQELSARYPDSEWINECGAEILSVHDMGMLLSPADMSPCCTRENRGINGGCKSCGDPSL